MDTYTKKVSEPIDFADILQATQKLKKLGPDPIKEIRFGARAYKAMVKEVRKNTHPKKKIRTLLVGTLFGIRVIQDSTLKTNEYRIISGY